MQNLLEQLKATLQGDERLVVDGELVKNKIVELALAMDEGLLALLLENAAIKNQFFKDVSGVLVFDKVAFQRFVSNKQFLPDSYTAFKNKIGLTANNAYLTESKEVVLTWPYKDCVLEGGQTKEEQKRKEIFWNETLASDEIDRLLDPKVLTHFKRYDKDGEHEVEDISLDDNLIIKGNNLLALHSLKKQYAGKVKLIYIDPPYNTGSDSFGYNDSFNHSTWLTFMRNRLEVARELLKDDGVIFVQCDDNEQAYLKVLMDEVFGRGDFIATLPVVMNLKGNQDQFAFAGTHEYIHVCTKEKINSKFYQNTISDDELSAWVEDGVGFYKKGANLKATGTNAPKEKRPNLYFPVYISNENKISLTKLKADDLKIFPITDNQNMSWRWSREKFEKEKHNIIVVRNNHDVSLYKKQRPVLGELPTKKPKSIFYKPSYSSGNGTSQIKQLFGGKAFTFSKPEELIRDIVEITTKPNDLIMDYHLGSGTTAAVAHKMGRRYIGIEQMGYIHEVTCERLKKVIAGEQGGISKAVNWQGGGSFTYCELTQHNANIIDKIEQARTSKALTAIWREIENTDFISYKIKPEVINKNIHEFADLSLEEQKQFLIAVLDKNQLYVNYSEIDDADYQVSDDDKRLNKQFYGD